MGARLARARRTWLRVAEAERGRRAARRGRDLRPRANHTALPSEPLPRDKSIVDDLKALGPNGIQLGQAILKGHGARVNGMLIAVQRDTEHYVRCGF